jgi:drug/metabolite transporter (DMT)-like permease
LGLLLYMQEGRAGFTCPKPWLQLARGASISVGSVFFFLSIFVMPLTEATVIQFINPMLVALLSGLFLNERAPKAAWVATGFAFVGVLIVLRPEVAAIGWSGTLPLIAAFGLALTIIFNRMANGLGSTLQMQFLIAAFATPILIAVALIGNVSGIAALHAGMPSWTVVARCALVACSASLAHSLVYLATTKVSAARMAPAVFSQLLVAMALGYLIFGDRPDAAALGGAGLIIAAGLYLWRAGARL